MTLSPSRSPAICCKAETEAEEAEHLIATAYLMLGAHNYEEQDKRVLEMDVADEQIDAIGRGLLGMTVSCARCHDHKFDPIPTTDYYALAGIFRGTKMLIHENVSKWTTRKLPVSEDEAEAIREHEAAADEIEGQAGGRQEGSSGARSRSEFSALEKKLAALEKKGPQRPTAMAVEEAEKIEDCRICIRGSVQHRGPAVPRGVLQVATLGDAAEVSEGRERPAGTGGVDRFAAEPADGAGVCQSRVALPVRRRGWCGRSTISARRARRRRIPSCSIFWPRGSWRRAGARSGCVRELVLSRAYRMSTADNAKAAAVDPENRLLWRMNRKRLDAESLRDAMLSVNGQLDLTVGGPNIVDQER